MPIVTPEEIDSAKLDYVVIGGGTSGLTLAARYVFYDPVSDIPDDAFHID